jgi:hypothetical protein
VLGTQNFQLKNFAGQCSGIIHSGHAMDISAFYILQISLYINYKHSEMLPKSRAHLLYFWDYGSADLPFPKSRKNVFPTFNPEALFFFAPTINFHVAVFFPLSV